MHRILTIPRFFKLNAICLFAGWQVAQTTVTRQGEAELPGEVVVNTLGAQRPDCMSYMRYAIGTSGKWLSGGRGGGISADRPD